MTQSINRELLLIKSLYFFELSIYSCLHMYMTVFMYEYGITATELAILNFGGHIATLFYRPVFGFMADEYQKYREIISISSFLCALLSGLKLAIPKYSPSPLNFFLTENFTNTSNLYLCYANKTDIFCWLSPLIDCQRSSQPVAVNQSNLYPSNVVCESLRAFGMNASVQLDMLSPLCKNVLQNCTAPQIATIKKIYNEIGFTGSLTFWLFLLIKPNSHGLSSATHGLTDAVTFVKLDKERSDEFGFTRTFGSIGSLVFSVLTGFILSGFYWLYSQHYSITIEKMMSVSQYIPCFILGIFMFLMVSILAIFLKNNERIHNESFWKSMNTLFSNVEISVFMVFAISGGFIHTVLTEYYFLIMTHMFHDLPKYFLGLIHAMMTFSEIVFMGTSPYILKYINNELMISIAFAFWSLKWLSYIFARNYWLFLLIEVLHGPAFGLMLICMMLYISRFADQSTQGRIQSVFSSFFYNIGGALGALYGGTILDHFGYHILFISMAVFSALCTVLYYPIQGLVIMRYCMRKDDYITNEREIEMFQIDKLETYV